MDSHPFFLLTLGTILCIGVFYSSRALSRPYEYKALYQWSPLTAFGVVSAMGAAFFYVGTMGQNTFSSASFMTFIAVLTLLGLLDARLKVLPNILTLPLLLAGLAMGATGLTIHWTQSLVGAATGFLLLYIPAIAYSKLTGRDGVGYGDFKLLAAIGAWIGWQPLLYILFLAGLSVSVFGIIFLKARKLPRTHTIPFGPFLTFFSIAITLWLL